MPGKLHVFEVTDPVLNRVTRTAELLDPSAGAPLPNVLTLRDAQLLHRYVDTLIFSRIERLEDVLAGRPFNDAQTWRLEFQGVN